MPTTEGRVYDVPFSALTFTKDGDNLISNWIEEEEEQSFTYVNFFTTKPVDKIWTKDGQYLTDHILKDDALIIIPSIPPQYTGSDYNEKMTATKETDPEQYYEGANPAGEYIGISGDTRMFVSKVDGAKGNDIITGTDDDDWLVGGEGNDTIYGGSGVDMIAGNEGDDTIYAGTQNGEEIEYSTDNTEIYGGAGNDTIHGGKGNDFIWAGEGNDTIYLNGGSNYIVYTEANGGNDVIFNATGSDTLILAMPEGETLNGFKFSQLTFTRYVDDKGNLTDDLIITISDKNSLTVKDFFKGENLSDNLDKIIAIDNEDETKQKEYSIINNAVINVRGVNDYEGYNVLDNETTVGYTEKIISADKGGTIYGNIGNDTIYGGKGNDIIRGNEGDDTIYAGSEGRDYIYGDDGDDVIIGSETNIKSLDILGGKGNDKIKAGHGNDYIQAGEGNDETDLTNGGVNNLVFIEESFGADTIKGGCIDDTLTFAVKYRDSEGEKVTQGYSYKNLKFDAIEGTDGKLTDLKISATYKDEEENETVNTVLLKNYANSQINNVIAFDENGDLKTYSILDFIAIDRNLEPDKKGVITGTKYADIINGVADKNNTIKAKDGNDLITAGTGNDKIYAGEGTNEIFFSKGDGKDTVYSDGGKDYLIFKGFDDATSFSMAEVGKNLVLNYGETDSVTLTNFLKGNHSVKGFTVKDQNDKVVYTRDFTSTTKTIIDIQMDKKSFTGSALAETICGTAENNTIKGGGGNDIIDAVGGDNKIYTQSRSYDFAKAYAGTGKDTFNAGKGVDTFIFGDGYCNDTVVANSKGSVVLDISNLSNVSFEEKGKNLVITNHLGLNSETITVKDYLKGKLTDNINITSDGSYVYNLREYLSQNETFTLGDKTSDKKQNVAGTFLDETLLGGNANDTLKSGSGKDVLNGGKGNDKLYGYIAKVDKKYLYAEGTNSKEYVFRYNGTGEGKDTIYNSKNSDKIIFNVTNKSEAQSLLQNMSFDKSKSNLVIAYVKDTAQKVTDSITISNYYKLDGETEALRYVDITDGEQTTTIDLTAINQNNYISGLINEVNSWTSISASNSFDSPEIALNQTNDLTTVLAINSQI